MKAGGRGLRWLTTCKYNIVFLLIVVDVDDTLHQSPLQDCKRGLRRLQANCWLSYKLARAIFGMARSGAAYSRQIVEFFCHVLHLYHHDHSPLSPQDTTPSNLKVWHVRILVRIPVLIIPFPLLPHSSLPDCYDKDLHD